MRVNNVPQKVQMIAHYDIGMQVYPIICYKVLQAIKDHVFVAVIGKQMFPLQNGGGEEVKVIFLARWHIVSFIQLRYIAFDNSLREQPCARDVGEE